MIIDTHVHVLENKGLELNLSLDELLNLMRKHGVERSVIMATCSEPQKMSEDSERMWKEWDKLEQSAKDRLIPFAWLDDFSDEGFIKKFRGLKFHPSISQKKLSDLDLSLPNKLGSIMLVHCGRDPISHSKHIFEVAEHYKNIKFIIAHMGGNAFDLIKATIRICSNYDLSNIWFDTATGRHPELLRSLVDAVSQKKILFGSDYPFVNYDLTLKFIELAGLNKDEYEDVMYNNAVNLLGL